MELRRYSLFVLRVALGLLILWSGLDKYLTNFSAEGYLINVTTGPFKELFINMAGSPLVDFLVIYGEIGIGLAMVFGVLVRFASACGVIMMMLFYLSVLPPEHGYVSEHIIYSLCFVLLSAYGAGRIWGIDIYFEKQDIVKKRWQVFKYILG